MRPEVSRRVQVLLLFFGKLAVAVAFKARPWLRSFAIGGSYSRQIGGPSPLGAPVRSKLIGQHTYGGPSPSSSLLLLG